MLKLCYTKNILEAGCDEAGRGCLAGAVFAAAVILPSHFKNELLNDSKKLNAQTRNELRTIIENEALAFSVKKVSAKEIDKINILNASIKAMHLAIADLKMTPQHLLIDGNRFKAYLGIPHTCIIKGDGKYMNIAAASILAKTYRDEYMLKLDKKYPQYHWKKNKAYGTLEHRKAIETFGYSIEHRKSFVLKKKEINIQS